MINATNNYHFLSSQKYKKMNKQIYSATLFFKPGDKRPRKYKNISNKFGFTVFAKKNNTWYINWYDQKSGTFVGREYIS